MLIRNIFKRSFISLLVITLLSGCSLLAESGTVSDVTDEQLKYLLLEADSLPGFTKMNDEDLEPVIKEQEEAIKDESELCDKDRVFQGSFLANEDQSIFVNTMSEPSCNTIKNNLEYLVSKEAIEDFNSSAQASITNFVAQVGGGVKNVRTRLIGSDGFGSNIIIYETTADLIYEEEVGYSTKTYVIVSDKAILYISIESFEGYDDGVDQLAAKLVTNGQYKLDYIK